MRLDALRRHFRDAIPTGVAFLFGTAHMSFVESESARHNEGTSTLNPNRPDLRVAIEPFWHDLDLI